MFGKTSIFHFGNKFIAVISALSLTLCFTVTAAPSGKYSIDKHESSSEIQPDNSRVDNFINTAAHKIRHRKNDRYPQRSRRNPIFWQFVANATGSYVSNAKGIGYVSPNVEVNVEKPAIKAEQRTMTLSFSTEHENEPSEAQVEVADGFLAALDEPEIITEEPENDEDEWRHKLRILDAPEIDYTEEERGRKNSLRPALNQSTITQNDRKTQRHTDLPIVFSSEEKGDSSDYNTLSYNRNELNGDTISKATAVELMTNVVGDHLVVKDHETSMISSSESVGIVKLRKGAIQELKLHDDPAEAANQCNEQWWKSKRRRIRPKSDDEEGSATPPPSGAVPENVRYQYADARGNTEHTTGSSTTRVAEPNAPSSSFIGTNAVKGEKGDRGQPEPQGTCEKQCGGGSLVGPQGPPGPPGLPGFKGTQGDPGMPGIGRDGPPGVFEGLSDYDISRIAAFSGIKGEKGECVMNDRDKGYDRYTFEVNSPAESVQRGPKGDKGEPGLPGLMGPTGLHGRDGVSGLPGPAGPPGMSGSFDRISSQHSSHQHHPRNDNGVQLYQTTVELLSQKLPVGSLAFSVSSQQLFLAVNNGWRQILLGQFHAATSRHPSALINMDSVSTAYRKNHLSYWLVHEDKKATNRTKEYAENGTTSLHRKSINRNELLMDPEYGQISPPTENLEFQTLPPTESQKADMHDDRRSSPYIDAISQDKKDNNDSETTRLKDHAIPSGSAERVLHLIALNEPLSGDFNGVRGADLACYREARRSGFTATFRAFVSSRVQDINKIVHQADRHITPVVNRHGERISNSFNALFDEGAHSHVAIHSFDGRSIYDESLWPSTQHKIWHGSTGGGSRALNEFCRDWRSSNAALYGMASQLKQNGPLIGGAVPISCQSKLIVLCIENMSRYEASRRIGRRIGQ